MSKLRVDILATKAGTNALDLSKLTDGGRFTKQTLVATDSTTYNFTTTWAVGPTFSVMSGFSANSLVKLSYHMPCRNDSTTWGGMYIEPQISINGGAWQSLGSGGYDGNVMNNTSADIGSYFNSILIDPAQASAYTLQVRFYFRSYDGTATLNGSHDVNAISGTATLMSGNNGLQHYSKIIVEELAKIKD